MARNLIASKLVRSVRERAMIPDDIAVYTDEAILNILNEEIDVGLLDTLLSLHEEHLVSYVDIPHDSKDTYTIPYRAVGNKLRDIAYKSDNNFFELTRISLEEISDYRHDGGYLGAARDAFYVQGDEIHLVNPSYRHGSTLRIYFHIRPNVIVSEKECAKIVEIDRENGLLTFNEIPKNMGNLTQVDFIQSRTPNKILNYDIPVGEISTRFKTIKINCDCIPDRLAVGDYVCAPENSPYPNIPTELHPLLAQRAAVFILEALGDAENINIARGKLQQMETSIQKILDDRVEGAPRKIKNRSSNLAGRFPSSRRRRF